MILLTISLTFYNDKLSDFDYNVIKLIVIV